MHTGVLHQIGWQVVCEIILSPPRGRPRPKELDNNVSIPFVPYTLRSRSDLDQRSLTIMSLSPLCPTRFGLGQTLTEADMKRSRYDLSVTVVNKTKILMHDENPNTRSFKV